ncbi:putative membrane protein YeiB [Spinactinospora alkalitolerans]|uniref:Putative membrane protein YeiB n=1 Tax=Spinactinospora alkalitolerans TaxID=687207 RepID=A0A852U418_9ACTN|nr:DUF418 domain-containing protein [Spinactinospora alkalitolerans]NYE48700.1 putative membrane protein YeiB [Spinactinospora alkalitolerans]
MSSPESTVRGPVRSEERTLAPDLARGFMLLLIALANTVWYIWGREVGAATVHPAGGSVLDRIAQFVIIVAVDMRTYPMFALLFGYGMVQLLTRQQAAGRSQAAALALLRRRNLWLLAFGFAHAALLWMGDILGAYGLAGLLLGWLFLRRRDRTLLVWSAVGTGLLALIAVSGIVGAIAVASSLGAPAEPAVNTTAAMAANISEEDPLAAAVQRVMVWPVIVLGQGLLGLAVPVALLLGFWAARNRILEEPERHMGLLRRVAVGGIAIGWLGGLPNALAHLGLLDVPEAAGWVFSSTQPVTGLAAGVGYVALFGLIGARLTRSGRRGPSTTAVAAVGKRSLSCYLAQSVICAPLLTAWGLGWGGVFGSAAMAAFAVATWLVTVAGAYALERAHRRGPAEVLLRRLAYRDAAPVR